MAQMRTAAIWSPAPDDPFDKDSLMPGNAYELQQMVPPKGASASDDFHRIDRYAAEQLTLSVAQCYDTVWPVDAEPVAA